MQTTSDDKTQNDSDFISYNKYNQAQELLKIFEENENPIDLTQKTSSDKISREKFQKEIENFLVDNGVTWASIADRNAEIWIWEKFGKFKRTEAKDSTDAKVHIDFEKPEKNPYWGNATLAKEHALDLMNADKDTPEFIIGGELLELQEDVRKKTNKLINPEPNDTANVFIHRLMYQLEEYKHENKQPDARSAVTPIINSVPASDTSNKIEEKTETKRENLPPIIKTADEKKLDSAIDYMLDQKKIFFASPEQREKERKLQKIFGNNREEVKYLDSIKKSAKVIEMDYFRDLPQWPTIKTIPAKKLFDYKNTKPFIGIELSDKTIDELNQISKTYVSMPTDDETIEAYLTRVVRI